MRKTISILLACLLCLSLIISSGLPVSATELSQNEQEAIACSGYAEATAVLRQEMVNRQNTITVTFLSQSNDTQIMTELFYEALSHTGLPNQGDYLRWNIQKVSVSQTTQELEGQYRLTLTYTVAYYTTAQQEAEMDAAVEQLLDQLDVYNADDYLKICAIYDYICGNVTYDRWGVMTGDKLVYTAYAALIKKAAVCQGYATLLYRLALELGVDARVIPGIGKQQNHGWNIVRLDGKYYNLDATWDAENVYMDVPYEHFLRCDANFINHTRKAAYATEEFLRVYRMSDTDYSQTANTLPGDLTHDGYVDEDDAIYLLRYVLMPDAFRVEQAVDYNTDSKVNEDDAIYLLRHVLMPEQFPL